MSGAPVRNRRADKAAQADSPVASRSPVFRCCFFVNGWKTNGLTPG